MNIRTAITLPMLLILLALTPLRADLIGEDQTNSNLPPNVEVFPIRTSSPENRNMQVYLKRPTSYDPKVKGKVYRVLIICPYLNQDGLDVIQKNSLVRSADANGWFVVIPTFKGNKADVHDPARSYYYPKEFSGRAMVDALDEIGRKYPVDINHLFVNGLSGGAQFSHRFALYIPDRITAVAINSCSWFDDPTKDAAKFAWLVTIGDADPACSASEEFISKLRDVGALPIFKSYLGMIHEGDERVSEFDASYFAFYDKLTAGDLGKPLSMADERRNHMALTAKEMPFVGDYEDWKYYTNTPENMAEVSTNSLIYLPSEDIANLWGKSDNE